MSCCWEEAGAGEASSTQLPPRTGPVKAGPLPEESGYCAVMVDQWSWLVPSPLNRLVMYGWTPLPSLSHWLPQKSR